MRNEIRHANNASSFRLRSIKYLHCIVTVLIFFRFWLLFRYPTGEWHVTRAFRYDIFVTLGYVFLLTWFYKTYDAYTLGYFRIRQLAFAQLISSFFSTIISSKFNF